MNDDVQAAAERLRNADASGINYDDIYGRGEELDWLTLARAYLALHDPTPLDEAWLKAVGFEVDVRDGKAPSMFLDRLRISLKWKQWTTWLKTGVNDWITMSVVATRGDVRRLCAALGVTLLEEKPSK
jgi:hypothetical protein